MNDGRLVNDERFLRCNGLASSIGVICKMSVLVGIEGGRLTFPQIMEGKVCRPCERVLHDGLQVQSHVVRREDIKHRPGFWEEVCKCLHVSVGRNFFHPGFGFGLVFAVGGYENLECSPTEWNQSCCYLLGRCEM